MTAPAPSGPVKRSKRMYVYWGIALTLLIAVGLVCWLVVVPVWRVRDVVDRCELQSGPVGDYLVLDDARTSIRDLGGSSQAAHRLETYVALPDWLAPHKAKAVRMLSLCGKHGLRGLRNSLALKDEEARLWAAVELLRHGEDSPEVLALVKRASDQGGLLLSPEAGKVLAAYRWSRMPPETRR